jgi:hypothetical protein
MLLLALVDTHPVVLLHVSYGMTEACHQQHTAASAAYPLLLLLCWNQLLLLPSPAKA